jgi:hypothetical protein
MNQGLSWHDLYEIRMSIRERLDVEVRLGVTREVVDRRKRLYVPVFDVYEHDKISMLGFGRDV